MFLEELAFEGNSVLQVLRDHLEKTWHELDPEEKLCLSVQTPREQVDQGHQAIRLNHVVTVLSLTAELREDLNAHADDLCQTGKLTLRAR